MKDVDLFYAKHGMFCFCRADDYNVDDVVSDLRYANNALTEPQLFMIYNGYVYMVPAVEAPAVFLEGGRFINA